MRKVVIAGSARQRFHQIIGALRGREKTVNNLRLLAVAIHAYWRYIDQGKKLLTFKVHHNNCWHRVTFHELTRTYIDIRRGDKEVWHICLREAEKLLTDEVM